MVHPSAGLDVLEYLRSFPLTPEIVSSGFEIKSQKSPSCHHVPLLVLEALTSAPNQIDSDLDAIVVERSVELAAEIALESAIPRSLEDWLVAGLVPLLAKYGERGVVAEFLDRFVVGKPVQSVSRLQAFPREMSMGYDDSNLFRTNLAGLTWSSVLVIDLFVRSRTATKVRLQHRSASWSRRFVLCQIGFRSMRGHCFLWNLSAVLTVKGWED